MTMDAAYKRMISDLRRETEWMRQAGRGHPVRLGLGRRDVSKACGDYLMSKRLTKDELNRMMGLINTAKQRQLTNDERWELQVLVCFAQEFNQIRMPNAEQAEFERNMRDPNRDKPPWSVW